MPREKVRHRLTIHLQEIIPPTRSDREYIVENIHLILSFSLKNGVGF